MVSDKNSHWVSIASSLAKRIPGMLLPRSLLRSKQESARQKRSKPTRLQLDPSGRRAYTLPGCKTNHFVQVLHSPVIHVHRVRGGKDGAVAKTT